MQITVLVPINDDKSVAGDRSTVTAVRTEGKGAVLHVVKLAGFVTNIAGGIKGNLLIAGLLGRANDFSGGLVMQSVVKLDQRDHQTDSGYRGPKGVPCMQTQLTGEIEENKCDHIITSCNGI